jgi:energy-coupling factor transporter transmembrane protein EcfT
VRRPALSYEPGASRLHRATPRASVALLGVLVAVAFAYSSPIVLLGVGAAAAAVGLLAGAGRAVRAGLLLSLPLLVVMTAVNGLVYHRGDTVLVRGWTCRRSAPPMSPWRRWPRARRSGSGWWL